MRTSRILALLAVAAVIAVALLWSDRVGGGREAAAPLPTEDPDPRVEPRAVPLERMSVEVPPPVPPPALVDDARPVVEGAVAEGAVVEGLVVVIELDGAEHSGESGELVLELHGPAGGRSERVEVHAGRFALSCEPGTALEVQRAHIGGGAALVEAGARRLLPAPDEPVRIVLYRPPITALRVLDAETGLDLPRVTLLHGLNWEAAQRSHPLGFGARHVVIEEAPSPIELPTAEELHAWSPVETWFAGAEGYAWGRIEVDRGAGGEQRVELDRGGTLSVSIVGPRPERGAELRVRRGTSLNGLPLIAVDPGAEERVVIPALAPGRYVVSLEQGLWFADPRSLGDVRAEVRAGLECEVTLSIAAEPDLPRAPLAGTLRVGAGWEQESYLVVCELLDAPIAGQARLLRTRVDAEDAAADDPRLYRWSVGDVQPGLWRVGVFLPPLDGAHVVPPEGLIDLELELPPPVEIVVRIVDAEDGGDVPAGAVHWHPPFPDGTFGGAAHLATLEAGTGLWRIVAPRGPLEVSITSPAHELLDRFVEADGDPAVRELRARQRMGFRVLLRSEGRAVPWPQDLILHATEVHGDGEVLGFGRDALGARAQAPRAGRWRVGGFELPGYLPVPAFEVDVVPREFVAHEVQLENAP